MKLNKCSLNDEVFDIGKKNVALGLSWLKENGYVVEPIDRCLRNISSGWLITCSIRWIPSVLILDMVKEPL